MTFPSPLDEYSSEALLRAAEQQIRKRQPLHPLDRVELTKGVLSLLQALDLPDTTTALTDKDKMVKTAEQVEEQLLSLQRDHEYWRRESEKSIVAQNWNSLAPRNADHIFAQINALKFVLYGEELKPAVCDSGGLYPLDIRNK